MLVKVGSEGIHDQLKLIKPCHWLCNYLCLRKINILQHSFQNMKVSHKIVYSTIEFALQKRQISQFLFSFERFALCPNKYIKQK